MRRIGRGRSHYCHRRRGGERAPRSQRIFEPRPRAGHDYLDTEHVDDDFATHHIGPGWWTGIFSADNDYLAHHHHQPAAHHDHNSSCRHFGRHFSEVSTSTEASTQSCFSTRSFRALGTEATVVVVHTAHANEAERILRVETEAIDYACSRFRPDSELAHFHANAGRTVELSSLLFEALDVAYSVAERTHGAVDPTVGKAIEALGYDRDIDRIESRPLQMADLGPVPGFRHLHLDHKRKTARIPKGVRLDLGSSAKALLADRAAAHIANALRSGALVSIGGDIAVAGDPPPGGWPIGIAVDSSAGAEEVDQVVAIRQGGLASSSTEVRSWQMGTQRVHHIVDPSTGCAPAPYWRLVSASGSSCVDANALTTAALVWSDQAVERLRPFEQPLRLLRHDGEVFTLGGWPASERP